MLKVSNGYVYLLAKRFAFFEMQFFGGGGNVVSCLDLALEITEGIKKSAMHAVDIA